MIFAIHKNQTKYLQNPKVGFLFAIARIFLYKPQVLLLDEPTSSLDNKNQNKIFQYLLEYQKKTGAAYLIVSHDQELLKSVADSIFVLKDKILTPLGSAKKYM